MKIALKVMIEIKKENKIWEKYFGLIQVEVNHTYPELYTAGAVLVEPYSDPQTSPAH